MKAGGYFGLLRNIDTPLRLSYHKRRTIIIEQKYF